MKKGDIVMIFQDPVTCQEPEGEAKLLKLEIDHIPEQQFWQVKFLSDGFVTLRWVMRKNGTHN